MIETCASATDASPIQAASQSRQRIPDQWKKLLLIIPKVDGTGKLGKLRSMLFGATLNQWVIADRPSHFERDFTFISEASILAFIAKTSAEIGPPESISGFAAASFLPMARTSPAALLLSNELDCIFERYETPDLNLLDTASNRKYAP